MATSGTVKDERETGSEIGATWEIERAQPTPLHMRIRRGFARVWHLRNLYWLHHRKPPIFVQSQSGYRRSRTPAPRPYSGRIQSTPHAHPLICCFP